VSPGRSVVQGWPQGILMDGAFDDDEIRRLIEVRAEPDLNKRAIEALFRTLADFRSVREEEGMEFVLQEYVRMAES
jgi:hypothetical protein